MRLRSTVGFVLTALLTASFAGAAQAHPDHDGGYTFADGARDAHQHGDTAGHLPASTSGNIEVVGKTALKNVVPEKIADVGVLDDHAYLAAWGSTTCKYNGVHVVDISDVSAPEEVAFIASKEGSYPGEGIQAIPISTKQFSGDILVSNNEKCLDKSTAGFGGLNLYDVTDPAHPTPLAEGLGDTTVNGQGKKAANEIHSVFAWDAGDRAYVVMTDNEEGTDFDIMDITNPRKPFLAAEYDLDATFPQILQAGPSNLVEVFLHDMIVKEIDGRQVMLLSYWDAGYVKIDITNVTAPRYLGDTDFADPDPELLESAGLSEKPEGNAHQAEFTIDNQYVIGADEDFGPDSAEGFTDDDSAVFPSSQGSDTTHVPGGETVSGDAVYVGQACDADAAVPPAPSTTSGSQIAVVSRGVCTFTEKLANVDGKGYEGAVIVNREGSDGCGLFGMSVEGETPTFAADRETGYGFFDVTGYDDAACLAGTATTIPGVAIGTVGDAITIKAIFDGWGYVHLFDNEDGKMTELDTYAIPEAHDEDYATGYGDLSVHEVAVSETIADRLYFSYYSGGFRVVEIENDELVEKGHYIDEDGNNFWGVQVFQQDGQEYVAASDRDHGLWIFKYNP
ncbi:PA domain-containing protein [Promicromonospora soli]|nr:PA domain-containing protein [Promicromonospora soli]